MMDEESSLMGEEMNTPGDRAPRVSVIIPCFNQGQYLDEAVTSVLDQTFQSFEILVLDDGSTDSQTQSILSSYERPWTRVFRTENRGLAAARNFLVDKARGEFLCALDADDRLELTYFEKAIAVLDQDPSVGFVSSWLQAFENEEWTWRQERCDLPALLAEDTVMTAALVRRQAVVEVGGYDEGMPSPGDEDWDLWIRLVRAGHRGVILPEVLFFYRRRSRSMSRDCAVGENHIALCGYLMEKHSEAYLKHASELLLLKAQQAQVLGREIRELEDRVQGWLQPSLERRKAQLRHMEERQTLERSLVETQAEVQALRSSWSWRITAPLRAAYELILRTRHDGDDG